MLLFDTFVKTALLYGVGVWGSYVLPRDGALGPDRTGHVGSFYRAALRGVMGLGRSVRDEILYTLSGRWPI